MDAAIENARRILELRESHDSFAGWLDTHHPQSLDEWRRLFSSLPGWPASRSALWAFALSWLVTGEATRSLRSAGKRMAEVMQ